MIVLLTDGADTTSAATVADAANAALSVHARVFVVGLPGARTNRANLERLVSQTGGRFVQVRSFARQRNGTSATVMLFGEARRAERSPSRSKTLPSNSHSAADRFGTGESFWYSSKAFFHDVRSDQAIACMSSCH